ncbi:cupin domain-containing protein [Massilia sp. UMI-21]|nr:cupin domain-containing protein [Massilia sp. UMI-21]
MLSMTSVAVDEALKEVTAYWTPRIIGQVNDQYVKVAKLKGELAWHDHAEEDEMFFVVYGKLKIEFEDREVLLGPGQFCIVPKKTRHNPVAEEECGIMLIETVSTRHTGELVIARTVPIEAQLGQDRPAP